MNFSQIKALCDQAAALHQAGRLSEAERLYIQVLARDPNNVQAHYNRARLLKSLNRLEEALASCDRAIALAPGLPLAWFTRAIILSALNRQEEALAGYTRVIAQQPNLAEAYFNRGNLLTVLGRLSEAVTDYMRATGLKPGFEKAHYGLGNALWLLKRPQEALASYGKAIECDPDFAEAWYNRGTVLLEMMRLADALDDFDRIVALDHRHADAWSNRGTTFQYLRNYSEALASHDRAVELAPSNAKAWSNRGISLHNLGRFDEALASYDRAISLGPDFAEAHVNKSVTELLTGDWQNGWRDFEWRRKIAEPTVRRREFSQNILTSLAGIKGKKIFVYWEEDGFGDSIQFCRYVPLLRQMGAETVFSVQKKLHRLIGTLGDCGQLAEAEDGAFDCHVPLMNLPLVFETRPGTVPAHTAYLFAEDDRIQAWRQRLGGDGFKIGICWQGNSTHQKVDGRCFSPACFAPLAELGGIRFISLQKGEGEKDLAALPTELEIEHFDDLDAGADAFVDTAAVMNCLDLVITADTAIAHLAGALGVPTWLALQHTPDWRWMAGRADSPWYPSLRLFRQKKDGDWTSVFDEMAVALAGWRGA